MCPTVRSLVVSCIKVESSSPGVGLIVTFVDIVSTVWLSIWVEIVKEEDGAVVGGLMKL